MRRNVEISNSQDIIDSRDVIERIDELEGERTEAFEAANSNFDAGYDGDLSREEHAEEHWQVAHPSEADELKTLQSLAEEAEGCADDWRHGATLIRDSYFEDYAQQLADDLGYVNRNVQWPYTHINWEAAAEELKVDYTAVEFDGVTYWVR